MEKSLKSMAPLGGGDEEGSKAANTVFDPSVIPYELDVFFRSFSSFLPEGRTYESLSDKEKVSISNQYRFSPLRPGMYQGITAISGKRGSMLP